MYSFDAAEVTSLGFVCFVVINPFVLSAHRVDFGLFILFHKFPHQFVKEFLFFFFTMKVAAIFIATGQDPAQVGGGLFVGLRAINWKINFTI